MDKNELNQTKTSFISVVQLVLTYQNVTNQTGNQDMCYYNFLCAHPLGAVRDFNHIFSNLGYVMLGILFILIVSRKDYRHQKLSLEHRKKYGIPQHFGKSSWLLFLMLYFDEFVWILLKL